jgi:poly-gamma-glutamate capsule biosynthesis protein CapA/YwtB (metallophosphatase superfamily)
LKNDVFGTDYAVVVERPSGTHAFFYSDPAINHRATFTCPSGTPSADRENLLRLALCGDVMTGRAIDQILPHSSDPVLYEPHVRDAREYVKLAERANGPIPRPVDYDYIWGAMLPELARSRPDVRIVNLETSITSSGHHWPNKAIHYRMHPLNIGCIKAPRIDCCSLANNHVLDWGYNGLIETLRSLDTAGVAHAGAGLNAAEAASPGVLNIGVKGRLLLFSFGSTSSGIPWQWAAAKERPGVNLLQDLSKDTARTIGSQMSCFRRPGDIIIASIHWGANWGYDVPDEQVSFARLLIEGGVDLVHAHSSHHVKPLEVYRDRLILYGCGDFLNDYEGIGGYERFRSDLTLMYLATLDPADGSLLDLRLVPMQVKRFRLDRTQSNDTHWLCSLMDGLGAPFDVRVRLQDDNTMSLVWR